MPRKLKIGTVQMDAAPAPISERLPRAAHVIEGAAAQGAQLVVLPELFNTGYGYSDDNYALAEPLDGQTLTWMKAQAAKHNIHLAGSFLLLDADDIFNAAFLVAPDGRTWRYDKIFPYMWERAYFREGQNPTIADTDLGRLGMLICWDTAHTDLWRRYAGKVDAMVVVSCPPSAHRMDMIFPDGERISGTVFGRTLPEDVHFQDQDIEDQARWMRVPVAASVGAGKFRSRVPLPQMSVAAMLGRRPDWRDRLEQAEDVIFEAGYGKFGKVIDADGRVIARIEHDGDGCAVAEVELPDDLPQPTERQPAMRLPTLAHFLIDAVGTNAMIEVYREGVRRAWGERMAPRDPRTIMWGYALAATAVIAGGIGFMMGRRR